jgi:membrane-bound lytic murein transglycosylase D
VILSNANQQILLPFAHAEIFQDNLKNYSKPLSSWTAVKVSKTESLDQASKTLGVDPDTLRDINGIPRGMRIKAGSTVLIPKTSSRSGDVPSTLADNASLSLEKPPPPTPPNKCAKATKGATGSKAAQQSKCTPPKQVKIIEKGAPKGNSSQKNAASQHKSASTGLAKSAKNDSSAKPSTKGVSAKQ